MDWERLLSVHRRRSSTVQVQADHRLQFERDFDRAVFSPPVKRLQGKAQVFPLDPNDTVRTRLTHSLEVSSVARGLARNAADWLERNRHIESHMSRSIEVIAATCGLVHDLGNPPFGHAGEHAIRSWFERDPGREILSPLLSQRPQFGQDFLRFEGNAQSLRLVATLQVLADYKGLNFTYGTLSALMKYVAASDVADGDHSDPAFRKPGYFASESDVVAEIREATGTGEARHPIAVLVEAADDIVYLAADVEDGVRKSVLSWSDVLNELPTGDDVAVDASLTQMDRILKAGRAAPLPGLEDDIHASAFRTAAIGVMVEHCSEAFQEKYEDIIVGRYRGTLLSDSAAKGLGSTLRRIGKDRVYNTSSTLKLEIMGRHVLCDLMDAFWEGAKVMPKHDPPRTRSFEGKIAALYSENYRRVFQHFAKTNAQIPETYHRVQLLTDYVCGMTDAFATRLHGELFGGR
ncbi:MAG: dNTP triphosphohydrolase [Acidobacteria bacterium]|nr:dNTP triphosphohydrolase [Acidobacteriota bacterium]